MSVYQMYIHHLLAPQRALVVMKCIWKQGSFFQFSRQLQIQEGVFGGWKHCLVQKGVLEPREGGGQSPKLWVGGGPEF